MSGVTSSRAKVSVSSVEGNLLGDVSVALAGPKRARAALVLAHGAGGTMETPSIVKLQQSLVGHGVAVVRFNFLYTEKGKKSPDRQPLLLACWRAVADRARAELEPEKLFLGGRSMGGRMATYVVAEGYPVDGLVLLAYPLHPPGKPDQQRKEHLSRIGVPMLFVSGTRDNFARLDLLEPVVQSVGAKLHLIEDADHGFKVPKKLGRSAADVDAEVSETVLAFMTTAGG